MRPELEDLPVPNWFHHGEQILALLDEHRPMVCVELGSNRGCSAIGVARLLKQWDGTLTCVDLWTPGPSEVGIGEFAQNILNARVSSRIRMIYARTADAVKTWQEPIDYLYVDADHTREGCLFDLETWWPFLKVGGLIAGDDYDDIDGIPELGVTAAWDAFEVTHNQVFHRTPTPGFGGRLIWGVKR